MITATAIRRIAMSNDKKYATQEATLKVARTTLQRLRGLVAEYKAKSNDAMINKLIDEHREGVKPLTDMTISELKSHKKQLDNLLKDLS